MSTICANSSKWIADSITDVGYLKGIEPAILGKRHMPVNHGVIVDKFHDATAAAGLEIVNERGKLSKDLARYIYMADIKDDAKDFTYTLGFVNYNDETKAFQGLLGTNVFVCENGCIHGTVIPSIQRHTTNNINYIGDKVNTIVDKYLATRGVIGDEIVALKNCKLTDDLVGKYILNLHREGSLGATNIFRITDELENPTLNSKTDNTAWRLMNAATYVSTHMVGKDNPMAKVETSKVMHDELMKLVVPGWKTIDSTDIIDVAA